MSSAYDNAVLADSPVAFWPLNETSGTSAADATGNGHTGTYTGGFTLGATGIGDGESAVTLNGSTGYVTVPSASTLQLASPFSIEAWVSPTSGSAGGYCIVSKFPPGGGGDDYLYGLGTQGKSAGHQNLAVANLTVNDQSTSAVPTGWHHVVVTYNGSTVTFYKDGVADGTPAGTGNPTKNTGPLTIGTADNGGSFGSWFSGSIAKVAIYNVALTSTQVSNHYLAATEVAGTGAATFSYSGSATGSAFLPGSGSGSFAFSGSATGSAFLPGTGAGTFSFSGSGAGAVQAPPRSASLSSLTGLKVEIELGSTWTDITNYVTVLNTNRGRSRQTDMYQAGSASFTVRNDDRRFDPSNTASPYSPYLLPRLPVRITVATNFVFAGWADDLDLQFDTNTTSDVTFTCTDAFSVAANASLVNYSASQETSGARIADILTTSGYTGGTSIATGLQTLQAGTISGAVLDALQTAARSENGYLFTDRSGTLTFYDRHHLTNVSPSLQFSDQAGTAIRYRTVTMQTSSQLLFNQVIGQRTGGVQQEANDTASQSSYLLRSLSLGALECLLDSDVAEVCSYILGRYSQPQVRFASMAVNLLRLTTAQQAQVTALDLTNLLTITRQPPGSGTPSVLTKDCMVDGVGFRLQANPPSAEMTLTLADLDERNFFVLDSPIFGVLDTSLLDY